MKEVRSFIIHLTVRAFALIAILPPLSVILYKKSVVTPRSPSIAGSPHTSISIGEIFRKRISYDEISYLVHLLRRRLST